MLKRSNKLVVISMAFLGASLGVPSAFPGELCFEIHEIKPREGIVMVSIVNTETAFEEGGPNIASLLLPTHVESISACVGDLEEGAYGIRVMQDLDDDGSMGTNLVGMPIEPWGTSNDAKGSFGPPSWDDARFHLDAQGATQSITLNH